MRDRLSHTTDSLEINVITFVCVCVCVVFTSKNAVFTATNAMVNPNAIQAISLINLSESGISFMGNHCGYLICRR